MHPGDIVVATLQEPREQVWGLLIRLDGAGVIIRGVDARNFEEWTRQVASDHEAELGPSTVFYPAHRIERVALDEPVGAVPSMHGRFQEIVGKEAAEVLEADPTKGVGFVTEE